MHKQKTFDNDLEAISWLKDIAVRLEVKNAKVFWVKNQKYNDWMCRVIAEIR